VIELRTGTHVWIAAGYTDMRRGFQGLTTLVETVWPQASSGTVALTRAQLSMLLEGIDWRQPQRTWEPKAAG
jgi:transposase